MYSFYNTLSAQPTPVHLPSKVSLASITTYYLSRDPDSLVDPISFSLSTGRAGRREKKNRRKSARPIHTAYCPTGSLEFHGSFKHWPPSTAFKFTDFLLYSQLWHHFLSKPVQPPFYACSPKYISLMYKSHLSLYFIYCRLTHWWMSAASVDWQLWEQEPHPFFLNSVSLWSSPVLTNTE